MEVSRDRVTDLSSLRNENLPNLSSIMNQYGDSNAKSSFKSVDYLKNKFCTQSERKEILKSRTNPENFDPSHSQLDFLSGTETDENNIFSTILRNRLIKVGTRKSLSDYSKANLCSIHHINDTFLNISDKNLKNFTLVMSSKEIIKGKKKNCKNER